MNKLPRELLLEIIAKQNAVEYYNEEECELQMEQIKKRQKFLTEKRYREIIESLYNLIPKNVTWYDGEIGKLTQMNIKYLFSYTYLELIYNDDDNDEFSIIFKFVGIHNFTLEDSQGNREDLLEDNCTIFTHEKGYSNISKWNLPGLKGINPQFEEFYSYINTSEFKNKIICKYFRPLQIDDENYFEKNRNIISVINSFENLLFL